MMRCPTILHARVIVASLPLLLLGCPASFDPLEGNPALHPRSADTWVWGMEVEDATVAQSNISTDPPYMDQDMTPFGAGVWNNDRQLWVRADGPYQYLRIEMHNGWDWAPQCDDCTLRIWVTRSWDYGRFNAYYYEDGSGQNWELLHSGYDGYSPAVTHDVIEIPGVDLSGDPGQSVEFLTLTSAGDRYFLGIDYVGVYQTEDQPPPLSCPHGQFQARYFGGTTEPIGPPTQEYCEDTPLIHDWGYASPYPGIPDSNYSVTWEGTFTFTAGDWDFRVGSDDGHRLYVDGQLVSDDWFDWSYTEETVTLDLTGGDHQVRLEYYENSGYARVELDWQPAFVLPPTLSSGQQFYTCPSGDCGFSDGSITPEGWSREAESFWGQSHMEWVTPAMTCNGTEWGAEYIVAEHFGDWVEYLMEFDGGYRTLYLEGVASCPGPIHVEVLIDTVPVGGGEFGDHSCTNCRACANVDLGWVDPGVHAVALSLDGDSDGTLSLDNLTVRTTATPGCSGVETRHSQDGWVYVQTHIHSGYSAAVETFGDTGLKTPAELDSLLDAAVSNPVDPYFFSVSDHVPREEDWDEYWTENPGGPGPQFTWEDAAFDFWSPQSSRIIRGEEWGTELLEKWGENDDNGAQTGHMILFGVEEGDDEPIWVDEGPTYGAMMSEARDRDALFWTSHSFNPMIGWRPRPSSPGAGDGWETNGGIPYDGAGWLDGLEHRMVGLEIWNGDWNTPTDPQHNQDAIWWWMSLLKRGIRKVVGMGGSDFHFDIPFMDVAVPINLVYAPYVTKEDAKQGIQHGNVVITDGADYYGSRRIYLEADANDNGYYETIVGENVTGPDVRFRISVYNAEPGMHVRVFTRDGCSHTIGVDRFDTGYSGYDRPMSIYFDRSFTPGVRDFVRAELREGTEMLAMTNPIYFEYPDWPQ